MRKIIVVLLSLLFVLSCASSKTQQQGKNVKLNVETLSEGVRLTFDSIPEKTTRIFIYFQNWGETLNGTHDIVSTYTNILGSALDRVKETRSVICPFVRPGENYNIYVSFEKKGELWADGHKGEDITAEIIAANGIYFTNDVELVLNETKTGVTLPAEPVFSAEVQYTPEKYKYSVTIEVNDNGSLGFSDSSTVKGTNWAFEPLLTNGLMKGGYLQKGNYSAYVTVFSSLVYDNISWDVEIAKTEIFTYIF